MIKGLTHIQNGELAIAKITMIGMDTRAQFPA